MSEGFVVFVVFVASFVVSSILFACISRYNARKFEEQRAKIEGFMEEKRREVPRFPVLTTWNHLYHDLCDYFREYGYSYRDLDMVADHYYDLAEANDKDALVPYWVTQIFDDVLGYLNSRQKLLNWLQFRDYMKLRLDCSDEELEVVWRTYVGINRVSNLEDRVPLLMVCVFYDNTEKHQRGIDVSLGKYLESPQ